MGRRTYQSGDEKFIQNFCPKASNEENYALLVLNSNGKQVKFESFWKKNSMKINEADNYRHPYS